MKRKSETAFVISILLVLTFCPLLSHAQNPGNPWHFAWDPQSNIRSMRQPVFMIYSNTPVILISGNQSGGSGGNPGNQTVAGSTLFYRLNGQGTWNEIALAFHSEGGNNKYYTGTIPGGVGNAGDELNYYFRAAYTDHETTYVHGNGSSKSSLTTDENTARNNPFSVQIQATPAPAFPSPDDWRDINIYQLLTDRWYDGNPGNNLANTNTEFNPNIRMALHGGDFKGVAKKLNYLKSLGVQAIWISPIQLNELHDGYHGYGVIDWYKLSPQWGDLKDLRDMVDACHAEGIYVILDIVGNHMGRRIDSGDPGWGAFKAPPDGYYMRWTTGNKYAPPFDELGYFHNNGATVSFSGDEEIYGELAALDDLATEREYVRNNMSEIFKYWVSVADFDGFRIDTVRHVEIGFWQQFNNEVRDFAASIGKSNFFQFGEAFTGDEGGVGYYTGTKAGGAFANDAVLDYPLYFAIDDVFAKGTGNTKKIEDHYNAIPTWYDPAAAFVLPTFIDNHDNDRFLNSNKANNNWDKLRLALNFLYSSRGIPTLYYGTEQGFNGALGNDNMNRPDMFDGGFEAGPSLGDNYNMTHSLFIHVGYLNNLRRNYPSLRRGSHINRWNDSNSPGLFAYARRLNSEEVFVVVNSSTSTETLPPRQTDYAEGTVLVNLMDTNETITVTAGAEGLPSIQVPGRGTKMFVAQSLYTPLDPIVVNQTPSHDTFNHSVETSVSFTFSQPMDTNSVQNAFSCEPLVAGTFSWSGDKTTLTFTPDAPGFPGSSSIAIRIGDEATSTSTAKKMFAGFEALLHTGPADLSDSDGDGIPNWWTQKFFDHPLSDVADLSRPGDDPDLDGETNFEEYIAGTNPLSSQSLFRLSTDVAPGEAIVLLESKINRLYNLETASNLDSTNAWSCILSNIPGTGNTIMLSNITTSSLRFFRAQVELQ